MIKVNSHSPDFNEAIIECLKHELFIWHAADTDNVLKSFVSIEDALEITKGAKRNSTIDLVEVDWEAIRPFIKHFANAFSIAGMSSMDARITKYLVPKSVSAELKTVLADHSLSVYLSLAYYLIARLQMMYTARQDWNIDNKAHTKWLRDEEKDIERFISIIEKYNISTSSIYAPISQDPAVVSIAFNTLRTSDSHKITSNLLIDFLFRTFINGYLGRKGDGTINDGWQDKLRNLPIDYAIKDSFKYIHRNFADAFIDFMTEEKLLGNPSASLPEQPLKIAAELLNLSDYPFLNGNIVDVSVLKKAVLDKRKSSKDG
jgi:hypothetical protein